MFRRIVNAGSISVGISQAVPLYKLETQSARDLEYLAWQVQRVRVFKKFLPAPEVPDDEAEMLVFVAAEEQHQAAVLDAIATEPALTSEVMLLVDWIRSDGHTNLQQLVDALKVYGELSNLSDSHLARIHILQACWTFEGDEHGGLPSAPEIRRRALALFEETKSLSNPAFASRDISGVRWDRLFNELGIELKFPKGGWSGW